MKAAVSGRLTVPCTCFAVETSWYSNIGQSSYIDKIVIATNCIRWLCWWDSNQRCREMSFWRRQMRRATLVLFRRHQLSNTFATNLPYGPYGISPSQVLLEAEPHRWNTRHHNCHYDAWWRVNVSDWNIQHIDVHQMQSQNGPETDSLINSTMPTPGLARDKKAGHLGMWAASKTLTKRFMQIVNCSRESQNAVRERVARMVTKVKCRESSAKKKPKEFWRCKSYEGNQVPSQKPKSRPAKVAAKETKHVGGKARGLLKLLMWGEGTEAMPTCSCCICVFWSYEVYRIIQSQVY